MNKTELINAIAEESGYSKSDCKRMINVFLASITKSLKAGDKVALTGFGTFSIIDKKERTGINPSTKEEMTIPAKRAIKFKASAELADSIK